MSSNLIETLQGLVTPQLLGSIGPILGESEKNVTAGLGGAIGKILTGLTDSAGNQGTMSAVAEMVNTVSRDASGMSDLRGLLAGGVPASAAQMAGNQLLGAVFGPRQAGVVGQLASALGLKAPSMASLLSLAAPLVLSAISKRLGGGALTGAALGALMGQERSGILSAVSSLGGLATAAAGGVSSAVGSGTAAVSNAASAARATVSEAAAGSVAVTRAAASSAAAAATATAATAVRASAPSDNGIFTSFLWLILPVLFIGWLFWQKLNAPAEEPAPAPAAQVEPAPAATVAAAPEPAPVPAPAPEPVAAPALAPGMARIALAGGTDIEAASEGVESKLIGFINDASQVVDKNLWFNFDRLNFETGSTSLTAESKAQVANIVAILNAFPAVKVKIGGYTDNVGNPASNLTLSDERAKAVMAAIVAGGIAADRVEAEGYGEQHPVADNGTSEGRALNRRTAVSVRAK